jgi:predicted dienelactone hydrolase
MIFSILLLCTGLVGLWSAEGGRCITTDIEVQAETGPGLELRVHAPPAGERLPVVILSHGMGGSREGLAYLGTHLAAYGYVAIHPTHSRSGSGLHQDRSRMAALRAMQEAMRDPETYLQRTADVVRILDQLPRIAAAVPALAGRIDGQASAVVGHSLGACTTLMVAGAAVDLPGSVGRSFADSRPRAFVALSPQGSGGIFLRTSWQGIGRPMLMLTGSLDEQPAQFSGRGQHGGVWRTEAFDGLPADGGKLLCWLEGARHSTFSGSLRPQGFEADGGPDEATTGRLVTCIQDCVLTFLDAHVRGRPEAAARLAGEALSVDHGGPAFVRLRRR